MLLGIDHLVVAVPDPDAGVEELSAALKVMPGGGGTHPSWGTWNRLIWLGDAFIELLGITDPRLAAASWLGVPALAALETGPALVAWAIASDDLERDAADLRREGAILGPARDGERRRPDGAMVRWRLALPEALDLRRPFLIEHDRSSAEWTGADREARSAAPGRISELHLPIDRIQGLPVGARDHAVVLGQQRVVAHAAGAPTVQLSGLGPPRQMSLLGCTWSLD